jgi:4-hydroxybenzoate polyprenyltransferase
MPRRPLALLRSTHPGPALAVTLITVGLGIAVGLDPARLLVLGLSMLAGELSVGLSNDWIDAERDREVGRTDKPVAVGEISVRTVRAAAWVAAAACVILAGFLGWLALAAMVFAIGLAWAYNAGLKKSAFSLAPYVFSFASLPAIATLARVPPAWPAPWALVVGGLLGAAAHFANTLPDLDDDRRTGVRGLPPRLGRRISSIVTYGILLAASLAELVGTGGLVFLPADAGFAVSLVLAIVGIAIAARATRWHFRFIIIGALVDVAVLVVAGGRIIA